MPKNKKERQETRNNMYILDGWWCGSSYYSEQSLINAKRITVKRGDKYRYYKKNILPKQTKDEKKNRKNI